MLISYRSEGPVVLKYHEGCVSSCSFSKDGENSLWLINVAIAHLSGTLLASGGYDLNVNIYNTSTNKLKLGLKV